MAFRGLLFFWMPTLLGVMATPPADVLRAALVLTDEHAVSITVKAIVFSDSMAVRRENILAAGKRADEREKRRSRQMEICQQSIHDAKLKTGINEDVRVGLAREH